MRSALAALLVALTSTLARADKAHDDAVMILLEIGATCERDIFACEQNLRGAEPVFEYLHAFRNASQTEAQFVDFVRTRYRMPDFTMNKMAAHLDLTADVHIGRKSFEDVAVVIPLANGYDVTASTGRKIELRREKDIWVARLPQETPEKLRVLANYTYAARLKRAIMIYRMLEAKMMNDDLDPFARRFVQDLAPLVVAFNQKKELIDQLPDWQERLKSVEQFYSRFETLDDMRADIAKAHGLKP